MGGESPRWLLSQNRGKELKKLIYQMASANNKDLKQFNGVHLEIKANPIVTTTVTTTVIIHVYLTYTVSQGSGKPVSYPPDCRVYRVHLIVHAKLCLRVENPSSFQLKLVVCLQLRIIHITMVEPCRPLR